MKLSILPENTGSSKIKNFRGEHPMFAYQVPEVSLDVKNRLAGAQNFVVLGIGGSTLPLKIFVDAAQLQDRVHIVETVDPLCWLQVRNLPDALYFVVSKSGETLEIKTLLAALLEADLLAKTIVVTDPQKGRLRKWATENKLMTLDIPSEIGGRFTHFTPFHRALLERFGISFAEMLTAAAKVRDDLKEDAGSLEKLFQQIFLSSKENLILWAYGERLKGLAYWIQQAIAESLGKKTAAGKRVGVFPIVLQGPQDQHSVLQLLMDGPQRNAFWFFVPSRVPAKVSRKLPAPFEVFNSVGPENILDILAESTMKTFEERLQNPETQQPLSCFRLDGLRDIAEAIATVQAFVEYAGERLEITPFDQPGVERGKQIARELMGRIR